MPMGFRATELTLRDLFTEAGDIIMPPYQRGYSWTEKEALDLATDLEEACERDRPYFLGAIVVVQNSNRDPMEIIDGQQRLTTLTIIFAVLRDLCDNKDDHGRQLHDMIETPTPFMLRMGNSKQHWRLSLNHIDTPFFREAVQKRGATSSADNYQTESETGNNLLQNVAVVREYLSNLSPASREKLAYYLMRNCGVTRVKVDNRDQGYAVFRVLNTRGRQPSANDILKSQLLEEAGFSEDEAGSHSYMWNEFSRRLTSNRFDELLKLIWTLHGKPGDDLVSGICNHVAKEHTARVFLEDMLPRYVEAFEIIIGHRKPDGDFAEDIRGKINFMRALEHQGWRAPALQYLVSGDLSPRAMASFFTGLERLSYVLQFTQTDSNKRSRRYRRIITAIEEKEDFYSPDGALDLTREEKSALVERLRGRFATFRQRRAMSLRLNAVVEGGKAVSPDADATLEHILPRNPKPDSQWLKDWPDANQRRELVDCIGNFTLLENAENQLADRNEYSEKYGIFFKNGTPSFQLTESVRPHQQWTPEIVIARRDMLADLLAREWQLI